MAKYPESGLSAVLDLSDWSGNVQVYLRDAARLDKADEKRVKSGEQATKSLDKQTDAMQDAATVTVRLERELKDTASQTEKAGKSARQAAGGFSKLTEHMLQLDVGIRLAQQLGSVLGDLAGQLESASARSAEVTSIGQAFANISAPLGDQTELLDRWREQVQGGISDLELMRQGNIALINLSEESSKVLGENFGTIIQAALAGAASSGQDFNIILEKMVRGTRRQSNALLDDIGVWVVAEEAQQRYAEAEGLVVSQMTEAQKAAAWQAEAIRQMDDILAASGELHVTAAQQRATAWENAFDTISRSTADGVSKMDAAFSQVSLEFAALVQSSAPYLGDLVSLAGDAFGVIASDVLSLLGDLDPQAFWEGGANIIAALAEGMLTGLTYVVQVVNLIAQTISNFLMGFSPPVEGPLSTIDIGGANVIEAWLAAFGNVSLGPVEQLAGQVSSILSSAADLATEDQITVLEQLQERVNDRLSDAVSELMAGGDNAAEVRALDAQREHLSEYIDLLEERAALEAAGLSEDEASSLLSSSSYTSTSSGLSSSVSSTTSSATDKLAELQAELALNELLQDQYAAAGLETNDLLREELNLREQIAAEQASRGQDNSGTLSEVASLQALLDASTSSGGSASSLGFSLDEEDFGITWGTGEEGEAGTTSAFRTQLNSIFEGVTEDYETFIGEIGSLKTTLGELNPFEDIETFLTNMGLLDAKNPLEFAAALGNISTELSGLPADILTALVVSLTKLVGIDMSELDTQRLNDLANVVTKFMLVRGGISVMTALPGAITGIGTALTTLFSTGSLVAAVGLAGTVGILAAALAGLWWVIDRFGDDALTTLQTLGSIISIGWDETKAAIEAAWLDFRIWYLQQVQSLDEKLESIGIDVIPDVDYELDHAEAEREALAWRDEAKAVFGEALNEGIPIAPEIQMLYQEGYLTVSEHERQALIAAMQSDLESGDAVSLAMKMQLAEDTLTQLPQDLYADAQATIAAYEAENGPITVEPGIAVATNEEMITGFEDLATQLQARLDAEPIRLSPTILLEGSSISVSDDEQVVGSLADISTEELALQLGSWQGENIFGSNGMAMGELTAWGKNAVKTYADGILSGQIDASEAATTIAQELSDRLEGQSPPPVGPLSTIDIGGQNVVAAWLEAFTTADLSPVASFASQIAAMLGVATDEESGMGGPMMNSEMGFGAANVQTTDWAAGVNASIDSIEANLIDFVTVTGEQLPIFDELLVTTDDLLLSATTNTNLLTNATTIWQAALLLADEGLGFLVEKFRDYNGQLGSAIVLTKDFADALAEIPEGLASLDVTYSWGVPYGGARAGGGDVSTGQVYRVGEQGEEWFLPGEDGTIVPNDIVSAFQAGTQLNALQPQVTLPPVVVNVPEPVVIDGSSGGQSFTNNYYGPTDQNTRKATYEMAAQLRK